MYDISTGQITPIATHGVGQKKPDVFGDKIVWHDDRTTVQDIYMYDLSTNQERRITSADGVQSTPSIHGNKIVWHDWRFDPFFSDIFMYDLSTNQESAVSLRVKETLCCVWLPFPLIVTVKVQPLVVSFCCTEISSFMCPPLRFDKRFK